ncbi:MAG: zinc-binding dehydrogenase [Sediminibacterium sp.]|nr:zinc-binding dehydrogenase [Sediminibacterium sp.]
MHMRYFGSASCDPHHDGSMGEFVVAPASNCYVLPPGISLSQASLLEPLCVAMHAVKQVEQIAGKRVLITGGGPIGQLIVRVVKAFGAYSISVSDVSAYARQFAIDSGAQQGIDPMDENAWKQIEPFDIVFEASGNPAALNNGIQVLRRGGTLVLVGTMPETFTISGNAIMSKQLRILGSFRFANVFEDAVKMVAAGIINLEGMITDTFAFSETPIALLRALERKESMKIQIVT